MKTVAFLKDQGYRYNYNPSFITILSSNKEKNFIIVLLVAIMVSLGLSLPSEPIPEVVLIMAVPFSIGIIEIFKRRTKKSVFIDNDSKKIRLKSRFGKDSHYDFADIDAIVFTSKKFDEYTSAFKNTNVDYRKEILIKLKDEKEIPLFTFRTEYKQKESEIAHMIDWLKKVVRSNG